MPLQTLLAWWNLIFIVPFALALFYLGLFVFTGITFGDADADADMDADADADLDHDADMDADHDVDADADHDVDADHDAAPSPAGMLAHSPSVELHPPDTAAQASPITAFLSFLGIGKIPLSLALMTLLFCWGIVGFALNSLLFQWLGNSFLIGFISIPITLLVSLALTGALAALIAKIIPNDDSVRERRSDLVGKPAQAMYDINATFGMARVRGSAGDFFQVPCRTAPGKPAIAKGAKIVLFDYDRDQGIFQAALYDDPTDP